MPRFVGSSARARALLALPLAAVALAGCGTSGSGTSTSSVTATGNTLLVYASDPPAVRSDASLQDVVDAEKLAFTDHASSLKVQLKLKTGRGTVSDNARSAIGNDNLIAYLGEIQPGQSRQTVGITNAEAVLELSPTDGVRPIKDDFESLSSYGRTFASLPLQLTTSAAALSRADPSFATNFKANFGHAPSAKAILGYDAMYTLLRVVQALQGNANSRTKVTQDVIATLKANQGKTSVAGFTIKLK